MWLIFEDEFTKTPHLVTKCRLHPPATNFRCGVTTTTTTSSFLMSTSAYTLHTPPLASLARTPRSKAFSFQLPVSTYSPLHSSHCKPRRRRTPPMSSELELIQLNDESDFYQILSPDGLISISGFGSLLSGMYNCQIAISIIIDDHLYIYFFKVCNTVRFTSRE